MTLMNDHLNFVKIFRCVNEWICLTIIVIGNKASVILIPRSGTLNESRLPNSDFPARPDRKVIR